MLKRVTGGLFVLTFLLGTFAAGMAVGATSGPPISASCANGGYARYVDDDGARFPDMRTCLGWVAGHPGQPLLIDMEKLCSHGAHILYVDDDGNPFTDEGSCLSWVAGHPGQPPVAMDLDGPDDGSTTAAPSDNGQTDAPPPATDTPDDGNG